MLWILNDEILEKPFGSDRYLIDESTWKQLHEEIRWMTNSEKKNGAENLAHLPSALRIFI